VQDKNEEALTNQVNITIIQILKHEWNTSWKNFIPDLCASSRQDQNLCENNLKVLKLLSQEIFDFSKNQMTS
jgi:exportin-1